MKKITLRELELRPLEVIFHVLGQNVLDLALRSNFLKVEVPQESSRLLKASQGSSKLFKAL